MKSYRKLFIIPLVILLLTSCKSYNVKVDLTSEENQAVQKNIEQLKESIANFVPPSQGTIDWQDMIDLSKAYEKLGKMDKAIKVYTDVLDSGAKTKAIINNLGRLYEQVGEYDLAVAQYQRIVDEYNDEGYLYDITWIFIHAAQVNKGDEAISYRKKAEKVFNAWQLAFQKTDEQTQQEIKKLREKEKNL
jgi:tetratricopeptide (TPR) repeat protein